MTEDEVRALLTAAMAYDNRRPGELNVRAWTEAANRAGWTFPAALEALHAHYAESIEFLMPGHITKRLRASQGLPPRHEALPPAQPASEETRRRLTQLIGDRFAIKASRRGRPSPSSPEHAAAVERARAELDAIRARSHT